MFALCPAAFRSVGKNNAERLTRDRCVCQVTALVVFQTSPDIIVCSASEDASVRPWKIDAATQTGTQISSLQAPAGAKALTAEPAQSQVRQRAFPGSLPARIVLGPVLSPRPRFCTMRVVRAESPLFSTPPTTETLRVGLLRSCLPGQAIRCWSTT